MRWRPRDMQDQSGRTFVVTGANSGIGYHAAKHLARAGADVVLACRRMDAAEQAVRHIGDVAGSARAMHLDLADLDSVQAFAAAAPDRIDVLVNNAGVMMTPAWRTKQGYEWQWGINVVGHARLTHALLDRITDRVVTVSSLAHQAGWIDPETFHDPPHYHAWKAYSQSKLGDLIFALELQRHLDEQGSAVRSVAAHPGVTLTRLAKDMRWYLKLLMLPYVPLLQGGDKGSWPTLYAATMAVEGGSYWGPRGLREWRGAPSAARIARRAHHPANRAEVWNAVWPA